MIFGLNFKKRRIIIFFLAVLAVGLFIWLWFQFFIFSSSGFQLSLDMPSEASSGGTIDVYVNAVNKTTDVLTSGELSLSLPDGLELVSSSGQSFDALQKGGEVTAHFVVKVAASQGQDLQIIPEANFKAGAFSSVFKRQGSSKTIHIKDLQLLASFSFPSDASAGKPMTFSVRYSSQADNVLGPIGLKISAPGSFHITALRPDPLDRQSALWDLGDLSPESQDRVYVSGYFDVGSLGGEFSAQIGILDTSSSSLTSYKEYKEVFNFQVGTMSVDIIYSGQTNPSDSVVKPGDDVNLKIHYANTSSLPINNPQILLAFANPMVDQRAVSSSDNFTRTVSGEYQWDGGGVLALRILQPQASGDISFSSRLSPNVSMKSLSDANQIIVARVRAVLSGQVLGERQVSFKIDGGFSIADRVLYNNAPGAKNYGPVPPKVGEQTSYTVTLTAANNLNGIKNAVVYVILGPSVDYGTLILPSGEKLSYNSSSREVRWDIGDMPAGTGVISQPKVVSFQIILTPSQSDLGRKAVLLSEVKASGVNVFTGLNENASASSADTGLPDDSSSGGVVTK